MKKISVFVCLLGVLVLSSCSNDDKDSCRKVTSSSGTKENGVMVYRVSLDNGERLVVNEATAKYYTKSGTSNECYSFKN
jgi:hypothetical protein